MTAGGRSDLATDLTIGFLLTTGVACWVGLVAGELGRFGLAPVGVAGALAAVAGAVGLRRRRGQDAPGPRGSWRTLDGLAVFVLVLLLYAPGYDTTLFGSDATVYLASGAHLARTGALAIEDPLLDRLPPEVQMRLFRPTGYDPNGPHERSLAGLAYHDHAPPVYSSFSQLPSVWLAVGHGVGGAPGEIFTSPLLAAAAMAAFYLCVRRLSDVPSALLATAILAATLPQLVFARVSTGEAGAQFFLWAGFLALARWMETRLWLIAGAAGLGLGLAGLARPEYIAFVPLALLLHRLCTPRADRLSPLTLALTAGLLVHGIWLLLVTPSHYVTAISATLIATGLAGVGAAPGYAPVLIAAVAWGAARALAPREARAASGGGRLLDVRVALVVVPWAVAYAMLPRSPSGGQAIPWLHHYTGWTVLALAVLGLPVLIRGWWRDPAGRLAILVGAVAAGHLLWDLHTTALPLWAGRRLLPMVLPVLVAGAAAACVALGRLARPAPLLVGLLVVALNLGNSRSLFGRPYLEGTGAATAEIAQLFPADALVFVDGGLLPTLLDVPLWLTHEREAVLSGASPGSADAMLPPVVQVLSDVPVYLIRQATLSPPSAPGLVFEPAGEVSFRVMVFGKESVHHPGVPLTSLVRVRAFRVVPDPRLRLGSGTDRENAAR